MGYEWDMFLEEFKNFIPFRPLNIILKAYSSYIRGEGEEAANLMQQ